MLRREADGVAWAAARDRLLRRSAPEPVLVLYAVQRGSNHRVSETARRLHETLSGSLAAVGAAAKPGAVGVAVGSFDREYFHKQPDRFPRGAARLASPDATGITFGWAISQDSKRPLGFGPNLSVWGRLEERPGPGDPDAAERTDAEHVDADHVDTERAAAEQADAGSKLWEWQAVAALDANAPPSIDVLAEHWAQDLRALAAECDLVWGAVYYDCWTTVPGTPYELYFTLEGGALAAPEHPRGYFWCNLLNPRHLERLGGPDAVTAACAEAGLLTEPVPRGKEPAGLILRAPGPITQLSDETLDALRSVLDPALIHQPYWWYSGPPLRVFKEPGTAFRSIPPEVAVPAFDDD